MKLLISPELKNLLIQFENQSAVASLILKEELPKELACESPANYISISSEDPQKISYLTQDRIKIIDSEDEKWTSKKRFHCKPGAFVGKLFQNISYFEVEKFSTLFRSYAKKKSFRFKVVFGENIQHYYHEDSYESLSGSLGVSCMRYENCQRYFDLYTENKEVSMLVMLSDSGRLLGRALLWEFDSVKVMDRIYTVCDEDFTHFFKSWAYENGYIHKSKQNWSNTLQFDSKDDKWVEMKLKIKLKFFNFHLYPYLDTFKWLDSGGYLYNYAPDTEKYIVLSSPSGGREGSDFLEFDKLGRDWHNRGNLVYVQDYDFMTSDRYVVYCEYLDKYLLKSDATYSEKYEDFIYIDSSKNNFDKLEARLERIIKIRSEVNEDRKNHLSRLTQELMHYLEPPTQEELT